MMMMMMMMMLFPYSNTDTICSSDRWSTNYAWKEPRPVLTYYQLREEQNLATIFDAPLIDAQRFYVPGPSNWCILFSKLSEKWIIFSSKIFF
jgi:5-formyltetrahydrofolate cyclo-ligase